MVPLCMLRYLIENNKMTTVGSYESMLEFCHKGEFVAMADRTSNYVVWILSEDRTLTMDVETP